MAVYEIGDIVTPLIDYQLDNVYFPTAGNPGTVSTRSLASFSPEGEDDVYNYFVTYPEAITGIDIETEEPVEGSMRDFWFSSEDLGIPLPTVTPSIDVTLVDQALNIAKQAADTSENVLTGLVSTMGSSSSRLQTVEAYLGSVQRLKPTLQNVTFDYSDQNTLDASSYEAALKSDILGNDAVILQEAGENLAQIQSVLDEIDQQNMTTSTQASEQDLRAREAEEDDLNSFIDQFAASTVDPRIISDVRESPESFSYLEENLTETEPEVESEDSVFELPEN